MIGRVLLVSVAAATVVVLGVAAQEPQTQCGECDSSKCPLIEECPGAQAMDACNCCPVCQRSLGQRCDVDTTVRIIYGPCEDFLECRPRPDIGRSDEATCQCREDKEVCGSDNVTYSTKCHLLTEAKNQPELTIQKQGACFSKPVIKTPPMSSKRPLGGILVLDCEAVGFPVPTIVWELYKPDGSTIQLPNDDSGIAVQIRGGPEHHMVTGWVQIMKVSKDNIGTYVCNAINSEGKTMATATITYSERGN